MAEIKRRFMMGLGVCVKCFHIGKTERHHIWMKKWYGKHGNISVIYLCPECHKEIHQIIPKHRKLGKDEYEAITKSWLRGIRPVVIDEEFHGLGIA
jgi:phage terminase large subunit GpA-like protein